MLFGKANPQIYLIYPWITDKDQQQAKYKTISSFNDLPIFNLEPSLRPINLIGSIPIDFIGSVRF